MAEKASFSSREPEKKRPAREPRSYRTGRNAQFTIKAYPDVIAEFYAITEAEDWVLGETLEKAVLALKEQRASRSRAGKG